MGLAYEADVEIIREMLRIAPHRFVEFLKCKTDNVVVSVNKNRSKTFFAKLLYRKGYSIKQIAKELGERESSIKKRLNSRVNKSTMLGLYFLDGKIYALAGEYAISVTITKRKVKKAFAMEFLKAGWSNKKIAKAVGISVRTLQRIKRSLYDE